MCAWCKRPILRPHCAACVVPNLSNFRFTGVTCVSGAIMLPDSSCTVKCMDGTKVATPASNVYTCGDGGQFTQSPSDLKCLNSMSTVFCGRM